VASAQAQGQASEQPRQKALDAAQQQLAVDAATLTNDEATLSKDNVQLQNAVSAPTAAGCPNPPAGSTANCSLLQSAVGVAQTQVVGDLVTVNGDQSKVIQGGQNVQAAQLDLLTTRLNDQASIDKNVAQAASDQQTLAADQQSVSNLQTQLTAAEAGLGAKTQADQIAVNAATAKLQSEKQNAKHTTITAPVAGKIIAVNIQPGELVAAGNSTTAASTSGPAPVGAIEIASSGGFEAQTVLSGRAVEQVAVGDQVQLAASGTGAKVHGTVSSLGIVATDSSGQTTLPITIAVARTSADLYPGMALQATITLLHESNVLTVPSTAVHTSPKGDFVYEVVNGKETRHPVTAGAVGTTSTQITSGLTQGTQVVTSR
jgi:multidrug efflux pump subunit AcrA (membrane-fusion protein)